MRLLRSRFLSLTENAGGGRQERLYFVGEGDHVGWKRSLSLLSSFTTAGAYGINIVANSDLSGDFGWT